MTYARKHLDEAAEIIRRLEQSDGLVVQGPPGTGKTHTIANIISHMLATGRRVLVVSHGETALRVIQDQLPEGVLLVDEKLERFRAEVHERFEAVDRRFEAIDQRFMRLETRVGALEVTVAQTLRHRQN